MLPSQPAMLLSPGLRRELRDLTLRLLVSLLGLIIALRIAG